MVDVGGIVPQAGALKRREKGQGRRPAEPALSPCLATTKWTALVYHILLAMTD